jgi:hypothetical protein
MTKSSPHSSESPFHPGDLFVSPCGNDDWGGYLAGPNDARNDGPMRTLDAARLRMRELRKRASLSTRPTVWVREGGYELGRALLFDDQDSGITFRAYPGERPVISGGTRVTGWQPVSVNGHDVWVADLNAILPEAPDGRSLYVNGESRPRCRYPKTGTLRMERVPDLQLEHFRLFDSNHRFIHGEGDFIAKTHVSAVEVVVPHFWVEERMRVLSHDPVSREVVCDPGSIFPLRDGFENQYARYFLENVFEAFSEPGEWYLNKETGKLYYYPKPGETPEGVEVILPRLRQFIRVEGKPGNRVSDLHFVGLTFEYGDWEQPVVWNKWLEPGKPRHAWKQRDAYRHPEERNRSYLNEAIERRYACSPQAAFDVPGAIQMEHAEHCSVEDCTLRKFGWYGIELREGCRANRIVGNRLTQGGAGGIKLDGADAVRGTDLRCHSNRITDNELSHLGQVFRSSVGILIMHSGRNIVAHNTIHHLFYTGISCGWRWDYQENVARDNQILYNHIHTIGQKVLSDMGGIYTLGVQPGTVVKGNHIHDVEKAQYGGWGLYPDEASSCIVFEDNLIHRTSSQSLHEHYGRRNIFRNNIFAFGQEGCLVFSSEERDGWVEWPGRGGTFENNIVVCRDQPIYADRTGYFDNPVLRSQLNVYWDYAHNGVGTFLERKPYDIYDGLQPAADFTFEEVQSMGLETGSRIADPLFADPANGDFTLHADSPAKAVGFKPFDYRKAGVRPPQERLPVSVPVLARKGQVFFGD